MVRRVAVAWVLMLLSRRARDAQSGSSGTSHGAEFIWNSNTVPIATTHGARVRRRRRSSATLDCGMCRPRRCCRPVSGRSSGYRRGTNYIQGFSNVGDFAGTFGVGVKDRAEIFGSFLVDTRIDRDLRPLFLSNDQKVGGVIDRYPRMQHDVERRQRRRLLRRRARSICCRSSTRSRSAVAVRGMRQAADGRRRRRARRPGKPTGSFDFIVSKETTGHGRGVGVLRVTSSAASPTASMRRAARSAGAAGVGVPVPRGRCAASSRSTASCRAPTRSRSTSPHRRHRRQRRRRSPR